MIFKSIKKAFAWVTLLAMLLVLLIGGGYVALRSPRVQTRITQYIADYLSKELNTTVSVEGVNIGFFNRLILEGLYVEDLHGDTLAYLNDLHLGLKYLSLDKSQLYFTNVRIDDLKLYLHTYEGDDKLNLMYIVDYFKAPKDSTDESAVWDVRSDGVELRNASFRLQNDNKEKHAVGIDYNDLDVRYINLLVNNIHVDVDTIYGNVKRLNCEEVRGFVLREFHGRAKVSPTELKVDELNIVTRSSSVALDLHYTYHDWSDYKQFVDSVNMGYVFRESVIDFEDIAFFAPALTGLKEKLRIEGQISGPVASMNARNLMLAYGQHTVLQGNLDIDGLPDIDETFLYLDLNRLSTRYEDLTGIPLPPFSSGKRLSIPKNIANLGRIDFSGSFTGFINDFVAYGKLNTSIGQLRTDISLKQGATAKDFAYSGKLRSVDFDLGKFFESEKLGRVTLDAKVVGKGLAKEDINAKLEGSIVSAELVSYDYRNISVNGTFARSRFDGELTITEPNIDLDFIGSFDVSQELPQFNFHSDISHANLYELNILRKRQDATVSGVLDVNFSGNDIDNILGNINIKNASYQQEGDDVYRVDDFSLQVTQDDLNKHLQLRSEIVDADFHGKFTFKNIPKAVNNMLQKHLPSYAGAFETLAENEGLEFNFDVDLKNTAIVSYFFAQDLAVSDSSKFVGNYSSSRNEIFLRGNLQEVRYKNLVLDRVQVEAENPGKEFELGISAEKVNITDSLFLAAFQLRSFTFDDSLGLVLQWNNKTTIQNRGFIQGVASFPKNEAVSFHLEESRVNIADMRWTVANDNLLTIDTTAFRFTDFRFFNQEQSIGLSGVISKDPKSKLNVSLGNFDLKNLNLLSKSSGIKLDGSISGTAQLSGLYDELFLTNQLKVDSLVLNDVLIGNGELNNTWIPSTKSVQVFGMFKRADLTSLSIVGEFLPGKDRKQNFNLRAMIDQLPLSIFDPYIKTVLSDVKGTAKADVTLKGTTKAPELTGEAILQNANLLFTYLNTHYTINDTVKIKKDGFYFENLEVTDENFKKGNINGWVKHESFKNIRFDANLDVNDFFALNTNSAMNSLYFGKAYGSGRVRFFGEPKNMHLEVAMRTERGTKFQIPLYGAKNVDESEFITFVKPKGSEGALELETEYKVSFKNLTLDLDVEVTSDAEVQLIFDPKVGDIIKGKGDGNIRMSLDNSGNFRMFGDYYINKGEYLFTLQNIINKKFLIEQGGTINWSGDPYNAIIDITGKYAVRTSLYELMYPDTSNSNYKRRIQVDCILHMTGNLLTPNIEFDVDLPNSDEQTLTEVKNRIGVGNVQEMNRQVFGLLVLNRFFPTESQNQALQQAGGFFSSSTSEMISNQLSNWLSKISNDFDIGINYRPGDEITSDELQASLSTQLFNNRIIIDGNVGVANTQSSSSNIVGDVNIEYKITSDGRFRVRAFNKSNDINALTENAPFTQGVGLSYQQEFDRLGDLFRRRKRKDYDPDVP